MINLDQFTGTEHYYKFNTFNNLRLKESEKPFGEELELHNILGLFEKSIIHLFWFFRSISK